MTRGTRTVAATCALAAVIGAAGALGVTRVAAERGREAGHAVALRPSPPPEFDTASSPTTVSTAPACAPDPSLSQLPLPAPEPIAAVALRFAADGRVAPHAYGVSIWVDGFGEVVALNPELPLAPASNQKLFTAMGALAVLGTEHRLVTQVRLTRAGDLVVVPGGDPTLTSASLDALADRVRAAGVQSVPGALFVDESRHDGARRAPGWQDWQIPTYTGPLSAFVVDDNRWRRDPAYLADPALANLDRLRAALGRGGITITGGTGYGGAAPDDPVVASLESPTVGELVRDMLHRSDNQTADALLQEIGVTAGNGSLSGGGAATTAALAPLCVPLVGVTDDGSGLSRANQRSAREWRTLLQAARTAPWGDTLVDSLPVAGRSGTLVGRFRGSAAEANVRAKTGTIIGGTALSGYGTTASGRAFVFSAVVNGPGAEQAAGAIDALVAEVAALDV